MKYYFSIIILLFLFSCDAKQEQSSQVEDTTPLLSVVKEYPSAKKIRPTFDEDVKDWKELKAVDDFLERFRKVSANEVLSNALELKGLVKNLKDSVKPDLFNTRAFNARVNIFYNETLRLTDMINIPAISADEVQQQTEKIINAFSAINAKVNTVLSKKRFEDEIDVDIKYIGLDSTKIDSVTRKSIYKKQEPKLDQKVMPRKPKSKKPLKPKKQ